MIVVALGFVPQAHLAGYNVAALVVKLVILFYGSEVLSEEYAEPVERADIVGAMGVWGDCVEGDGLKAEYRRQKTEDRRQKTEYRRQETGDRRQNTEYGGQE